MDIATVLGILSAFGLVFIAITIGGGIKLFIDVPSLMIVGGGTLGATMINYPLGQILGVFRVVRNAFFTGNTESEGLIKLFVGFANKVRREGLLSLEENLPVLKDDFLKKAIQLTIDGLEPREIKNILETEIDFIQNRHSLGAEIFTTMGTFAPALGMIGTLIGLIQMLQSMDDPGKIGPSMSVALVTTFYGSIMANFVCLPIAGKLRTRSKEEILSKEMIIEGVLSLSNGDNPRILEERLKAFVPGSLR